MSVPDLLPSSPPLPWFVIIAQALGLEGVGLRDLPPELASAMAARHTMDGGNWGGRPGATAGGTIGRGAAGGPGSSPGGLKQGPAGLMQGVRGPQGVGVSPARRQAGPSGRPPPRSGYQF